MLAHDEFLQKNLPESMVYFYPKDIVSGDFYWATSVNSSDVNRFYLAVCDSTGHGVPGAFMSLLNISFINEAINEKGIVCPANVFNYVREKLTESIGKEGQRDGFDGILFCFEKLDSQVKRITYAAANNAPVVIRDGSIIQLPSDRMAVGLGINSKSFQLFHFDHLKGDVVYAYTDGFADQFGGPKGKKYKYKALNNFLLHNQTFPIKNQTHLLKNEFDHWKKDLEQIDDVCVLAFRL